MSHWIALKTLLGSVDEETRQRLAALIPDEDLPHLSAALAASSVDDLFKEPDLTSVHYSWFIHLFENYSENDKHLLSSILSKTQYTKLAEIFSLPDAPLQLSPFAEKFLRHKIYAWLTHEQKEFVPPEYLPEHALNHLIALSKPQLVSLVDYLGLRDLSVEFKRMIQSHQINQVKSHLADEKKKHLKELLKEEEPIAFTSLKLEGWAGDIDELHLVLHQRGLNRLGKALYGCHPSLFWHICHKLDVGRAKILRKLASDVANGKVQQILIGQVTELIPKVK